jgi:hypothetical protein
MQVYEIVAESPQLVATFSQKIANDCASVRGRDFVDFYCVFRSFDALEAYFSRKPVKHRFHKLPKTQVLL